MGSIQKLNVIPLLTQTPAARSSRGSRTIMNLSFYFFTHMGDLVLKLRYLQGKLNYYLIRLEVISSLSSGILKT